MKRPRCVMIAVCLVTIVVCGAESIFIDVKTVCDSVSARRYDMTVHDSVTLTYNDEIIDSGPCKLEFYIPGNELFKKICSDPVNFSSHSNTFRLEYHDKFYGSNPSRVYSRVQPQREEWCGTGNAVFVAFSATTNSTGNIVLKLYATDNGLKEPVKDLARTLVYIIVGVIIGVVVIVLVLVAVVCFCCYRRRQRLPGIVLDAESPSPVHNSAAIEMVPSPNTSAQNGHVADPQKLNSGMAPVENTTGRSPVI